MKAEKMPSLLHVIKIGYGAGKPSHSLALYPRSNLGQPARLLL